LSVVVAFSSRLPIAESAEQAYLRDPPMDFPTGVELVANLMAIIGCSIAFVVWVIAFLKKPRRVPLVQRLQGSRWPSNGVIELGLFQHQYATPFFKKPLFGFSGIRFARDLSTAL
jgi:hypothetical protein